MTKEDCPIICGMKEVGCDLDDCVKLKNYIKGRKDAKEELKPMITQVLGADCKYREYVLWSEYAEFWISKCIKLRESERISSFFTKICNFILTLIYISSNIPTEAQI